MVRQAGVGEIREKENVPMSIRITGGVAKTQR